MQSSSSLPATGVHSFRIAAPQTGPHPALAGLAVIVIVASVGLALGLDGTGAPWHEVAAARTHKLWPAWLPPVGGFGKTAASHPVALPRRIPLDPPSPAHAAPPAAAQLPNVAVPPGGGSADARPVSVPTEAATPSAAPVAGAGQALPGGSPGAPAVSEAAASVPVADGETPTMSAGAGSVTPAPATVTRQPADPTPDSGSAGALGVEPRGGPAPPEPADSRPPS